MMWFLLESLDFPPVEGGTQRKGALGRERKESGTSLESLFEGSGTGS